MNEQEILEARRSIAIFDGWKQQGGNWVHEDHSDHGQLVPMTENIFQVYQYDYNDQIRVVEKIEQGNFGFKLCRKRVEIYYDDTKEVIIDIKKSGRHESLFHALHQFIQWYNKQQQPENKKPDLGTCHECKKREAIKDYNGHGYYVCQPCYDSLTREFGEEYK